MVLFEINKNVQGGQPVFIDTRVTVDAIRAFWSTGHTPEATHLEYPNLPTGKIAEAFKVFGGRNSKETSE